MIWPYLWALCAVLCLMCWTTSQSAASRALCAILAAYVAVRVASGAFGDHGIYLALGALFWTATAATVYRTGFAASSGIIMASALCYFWANLSGAPRVAGSAPFVASDVLMVIAMVWIGWHGVASFYGRALSLAFGGAGSRPLSGSGSQAMASKETARRPR